LLDAHFLGPRDGSVLIFAELIHAEVRADAGEAVVVENLAYFGAGIFGNAAEAGVVVADGRAELDGLEAGIGELLERAGKILSDAFADGPSLATNGKAKRVGAEFIESGHGEQCSGSGGLCGGFEKFAARICGHDGSYSSQPARRSGRTHLVADSELVTFRF